MTLPQRPVRWPILLGWVKGQPTRFIQEHWSRSPEGRARIAAASGTPEARARMAADGSSYAGKHPPNWKDGRAKHVAGYVTVLVDKYELEHRLVMAEAIGRSLRQEEVVHDVNGNKKRQRLEHGRTYVMQAADPEQPA
jgi:hypothetical protein